MSDLDLCSLVGVHFFFGCAVLHIVASAYRFTVCEVQDYSGH